MLEEEGFRVGIQDGYQDALAGKRSRPRPKLALCVMAKGYQENYLVGYHLSYDKTKQTLFQKQVYENARNQTDKNRAEKFLFEKEKLRNKSRHQKNQTRQVDLER